MLGQVVLGGAEIVGFVQGEVKVVRLGDGRRGKELRLAWRAWSVDGSKQFRQQHTLPGIIVFGLNIAVAREGSAVVE